MSYRWSKAAMVALLLVVDCLVVGGVILWVATLSVDQLGSWNDVPRPALLATVVAALASLPRAYRWIEPAVHDLLAGPPSNPVTFASFESSGDEWERSPTAALESLAATLCRSLGVPMVTIEVDASSDSGEGWASGYIVRMGNVMPAGTADVFPLIFANQPLGCVRISGRRRGRGLSDDDRIVAVELVGQVALIIASARMREALQASREQVVVAREEERRRIRRDLHDGLGPVLAAMKLQLAALRRSPADGAPVDQKFAAVDGLLAQATADVRRVVYGLRPPLLDDHGLIDALRSLPIVPASMQYIVDIVGPIEDLPAAVEVALYRIATEAVHNVIRHASATTCSVRLTRQDGNVTLVVSDNGSGVAIGQPVGVGIRSMYERADELGGMISISPTTPKGTSVTATLPVEFAP